MDIRTPPTILEYPQGKSYSTFSSPSVTPSGYRRRYVKNRSRSLRAFIIYRPCRLFALGTGNKILRPFPSNEGLHRDSIFQPVPKLLLCFQLDLNVQRLIFSSFFFLISLSNGNLCRISFFPPLPAGFIRFYFNRKNCSTLEFSLSLSLSLACARVFYLAVFRQGRKLSFFVIRESWSEQH